MQKILAKTLSIITINRNNAAGLEKTIQSVVCQTYPDFEFIIIDGASDDASVEIIRKYKDKIHFWVSEPDAGIYNAMNKGIRKAKGEYCLFLNSGDWLLNPDSISTAFDIIKNLDHADIYYGDCLHSDSTISEMPERLSIDHFYTQKALSHPNTFISRSLFNSHEFYNENFKTVSDSIFFVKEFWFYRSRFVHIKTIISVYTLGGISSVYNYARKELHEQMKEIMGPSKFAVLKFRCFFRMNGKFFLKRILPGEFIRLFKKKYKHASLEQ